MEKSCLDAATVARNAGIHLRPSGSRLWACCPLHGEKMPSMCFFPDGRFHCFGCGAHGDAADLYAALHNVPLAEALRICRGGSYTPKPKGPTAADLHRKLEAWKSAKWSQACQQLHEATSALEQLTPEQPEAYWNAVDRMAAAKDTLSLLESADMAQILKMCAEDS